MTNPEHKSHDQHAEQRIIEDVEKFGWHVGLFEATDSEPSFAYHIGLWKTFGHPEIISFGLPIETLNAILNYAGERIKSGKKLKINQDDFDILENLPVQFIAVDKNHFPDYFGYCMWFNEYKDFLAFQLVWTDNKGSFPWQIGFDKRIVSLQPMLNGEYRKKF